MKIFSAAKVFAALWGLSVLAVCLDVPMMSVRALVGASLESGLWFPSEIQTPYLPGRSVVRFALKNAAGLGLRGAVFI